jgi:LysR family hydrogen peroxide-inducible transcriptional activator
LKQLRYFVALAETHHFGRAAKLCHVTQPALSMQVRDLEARLGVTLIERNPAGLLLTAEGQDIARRAQDILIAVNDLTELVKHRRHPLSGRLRLGVIPSVGPYLLPKLLPELQQHYPELELQLRESQTEYLTDDLVDGQLDLLILALPVAREEFETMALFEDSFLVALPPGHRFGTRSELTQGELAGENLLLLEEGHCLRDQALALCQKTRTDTFRASSLATVVQMVANGYGITILPSLAIPVELGGKPGIQVVRFAAPEPARRIGLAWRASTPHKADFLAFGEFIKSRLRTETVRQA